VRIRWGAVSAVGADAVAAAAGARWGGSVRMRPQRRVGALLLLGALLLSAAVVAEGGSGSSKSKKSSSKKKGSKKPATLEVTIPEGARAGDKLNFVTPSALIATLLSCAPAVAARNPVEPYD
jgi:hypothetical protein